MINTILKKAAETFIKPTVSHPISQPEPTPEPEVPKTDFGDPSPTPLPAVEPEPIDQSPRALALRAAEAAGWKIGEVQPMAEICPHQPSKMFLLVRVENWGEPVICHVGNAMSWRPGGAAHKCLPPPHNRLKCRFTGTATAEGRLVFESSDKCTAGRYRRSQ